MSTTKRAASVTIAGRKYKNVADPLASWGTLRRDIGTLSVAKLRTLLKRELEGAKRAVILRALTGRINSLSRGDGTRGPRAYHDKIRLAVGLPSRRVKPDPEIAELRAELRPKKRGAKE